MSRYYVDIGRVSFSVDAKAFRETGLNELVTRLGNKYFPKRDRTSDVRHLCSDMMRDDPAQCFFKTAPLDRFTKDEKRQAADEFWSRGKIPERILAIA